MSDETITTAEAPAPKKVAKKSRKAKPRKAVQLKRLQFRVLEVIARTPSTRSKIISRVSNGETMNLAPVLGADDPKDRPAAERKAGYPSLLGLGYVDRKELPDGEVVFVVTSAGKKALENGCHDPRVPEVGSTITREYKGKTYKVKVLKDGFSHNGETYGSLTAVAKAIIGSGGEINGFAFFGLTIK